MTRRRKGASQSLDDKHGTMTIEAYERYEALKKAERDLRLADRDAQYRRALGLEAGQELPKQIGSAGGTRTASYNGVRGTRRPGGGAV